ncbi:hypothetical protein M8C21_031338 [Ambrosia artemisiifolia]|uniref:Uncharacterized protein n=1 Tax=Ambrosia artemisiifolia TaxID=4212 RepID=A0AAD5BQV6_AMBAR|nr:hypothetical protein M8C21_031338 [Ambrosia artemisiifolia]
MTLYFRTKMHTRNEDDGSIYNGALLLSLLINMFNGLAEISLTIARVPVVFKQRDLLFHPTWVYTLPTFLLRLPICLFESVCWMVILYYGVGLAPEASRFFKHFLLVFLVQNVGGGLFRLIAGVCRTMNMGNMGGTLTLLLIFLLGGFILPKSQIPNWWEWATWALPLSYGFKAFAINEYFAPRWMNKMSSNNVTKLGIAILENMDVPTQKSWYWIGAAALLGFAFLFNILFTLALMYLDSPGKPQAVISKEANIEMEVKQNASQQHRLRIVEYKRNPIPQYSVDGSNLDKKMEMQPVTSQSGSYDSSGVVHKKGMVLPFTPFAMSFDNMSYFVDMPQVIMFLLELVIFSC